MLPGTFFSRALCMGSTRQPGSEDFLLQGAVRQGVSWRPLPAPPPLPVQADSASGHGVSQVPSRGLTLLSYCVNQRVARAYVRRAGG